MKDSSSVQFRSLNHSKTTKGITFFIIKRQPVVIVITSNTENLFHSTFYHNSIGYSRSFPPTLTAIIKISIANNPWN